MVYKKGDLVLISTDENTSTCIILTSKCDVMGVTNNNFYYTYCMETGLYGVIYENEITSLVAVGFAPDFEFHNELFETDYAYHEQLHGNFSYFPAMWGFPTEDEDSSEED